MDAPLSSLLTCGKTEAATLPKLPKVIQSAGYQLGFGLSSSTLELKLMSTMLICKRSGARWSQVAYLSLEGKRRLENDLEIEPLSLGIDRRAGFCAACLLQAMQRGVAESVLYRQGSQLSVRSLEVVHLLWAAC